MEFMYDQSGYMPFEDILGPNIPLFGIGFLPSVLSQITNIILKGKEDGAWTHYKTEYYIHFLIITVILVYSVSE